VSGRGELFCWGKNDQQLLSEDAGSPLTIPTRVSLPGGTHAEQVSVGNGHICIVAEGGDLYCWGTNNCGEVGDGTTEKRIHPRLISSLNDVKSVAAGIDYTCAVAGSDSAVHCWGNNRSGELGLGPDASSEVRTPTEVTDVPSADEVVVAVDHTCALTLEGKVWCWGDGSFGQLGQGTQESSTSPVQSNITSATDVAVGLAHSCAVLGSGSVVCWGSNDNRFPLGQGEQKNFTEPAAVGLGMDARSVIAPSNGSHTCALMEDDTARCWGQGAYGELGSGITEHTPDPQTVQDVQDIVKLTAASPFGGQTCALTVGGHAWCWGSNSSGQLGDDTTEMRATPVRVVRP
jgi:hypothetical protein